MQYSTRFFAAIFIAAFSLHAVRAQTDAPLYIEQLSITNRAAELKDFNNAGEILASLWMTNAPGFTEERSMPVLIRSGGAVVNLYPIGTPNIEGILVENISQSRDDGGLYVAGTAIMKDGFWRAALWNVAADGSFSFRTMPNIILPEESSAPGEQRRSFGYAVNRAGVLVGSGDSYLASLATIWNPPYNNAVRYLLSTGSRFSEINEAGLLLANGVEFDHGNSNNRYAGAVTVAGGIPQEVPLLELPPATLYPNELKSMSGDWVAGEARLREGNRGFVWKIGSAASIGLSAPGNVPAADAQWSRALSVSTSGYVVGYLNGGSYSTLPILWRFNGQEHKPYFLRDLIVGDPYPYYRADADSLEINDHHQIAFVTRDWNQTILKVYKPLTTGFVELASEGSWVEEESGKVEIGVKARRAVGYNGPITVNFETVQDTAIAGVDYLAKSSSITWWPGEPVEKKITIQLPNDNILKQERQFALRLTSSSGAELAVNRSHTCTISDGYQFFGPANQLTTEFFIGCAVLQGQPQVVLNIERQGGTDGAITFTNFQASGFGMEEGVDFELPTSLELSWAAGEAGVKKLIIPLLNTSATLEAPKNFTITAESKYDGTDIAGSMYAIVVVVPDASAAAPSLVTSTNQENKQNLSLNISALQGTTIIVEKSADGLETWEAVTELRSEDGQINFDAIANQFEQSGFFRLRVKE